jgi:hypothetical protein
MNTDCYLKPAWTHNSSIRTDLPLMVVAKASKRELTEVLTPGQLFCVGKVYIKTHEGTVRIK